MDSTVTSALPPIAPEIAALLSRPERRIDMVRAVESLRESSRMPLSPESSARESMRANVLLGIERIKSGQISQLELAYILSDIRTHLESPKGTTRNDRLEDEPVMCFVERALTSLQIARTTATNDELLARIHQFPLTD